MVIWGYLKKGGNPDAAAQNREYIHTNQGMDNGSKNNYNLPMLAGEHHRGEREGVGRIEG